MTLRIVHLINSIDPASGGPANVLLRMAALQARRGHAVTIITTDAPEAIKEEHRTLEATGVRVIPAGPGIGPLGYSAAQIPALKRIISEGIDIAHLHGLWQHLVHWGASALRRARVPYIIRPCGMLDPWCLAQGRLKKQAMLALKVRADLDAAAALHFTTDTEAELVAPLGLKPGGIVIPNGIDLAEFDQLPEPGAFRRSLGIDHATPLVLFLSRLHHKKGLDLLLPAFAAGAPASAHLALVGPGDDPYIAQLKAQTRTLGIEGRTHFTGMLRGHARIEAFADADLFCLPSYQENFGVVVIEAGAAGTPVLISDQVNIHHQMAAAGAGIVVPCDQTALTRALKEWLARPDELRAMGARAREHHLRAFAWDRIVDQVLGVYASILHGSPMRQPVTS